MQKFLSILMALSLAGCSGAPIMSMGLSAEPSRTDTAVIAAEVPVVASSHAPSRRAASARVKKPSQVDPEDPNEEKADRATRELDQDVQRLERAAHSATTSICRGC